LKAGTKAPVRIPFSRVLCDGNEYSYVQEVLKSGWLTTAGKTHEFERRFAEATGARYACAVNSCTAAIHLALEAIGVGPGDKILVPTLTFTATAEVIRYLGADPVFLDVEYATGLLTPEILEEALLRHKGVKAVMVVHLGGQAAEMVKDHETTGLQTTDHEQQRMGDGTPEGRKQKAESRREGTEGAGTVVRSQRAEGRGQRAEGILEVCKRHGVRVIEDAAHAFPTRLSGRMVGSFGDATCFSFYANKTITTGEGGMLVTIDDAIYARAKVMRLHGIDRDIWNRFTGDKPSWEYDVIAPGFKYNMPDINAAIGLAQLERAEQMRKERQRCFEFYLENLADCEFLDLPLIRGFGRLPTSDLRPLTSTDRLPTSHLPSPISALEDHSCHLFWVVLRDNAPVSRNRFIELLAEAGIGTSVHYKPLHRMTYYRDRYGLKPDDFPNAERHWKGCVSLPVYPSLSNDELACVVEQIRRIAHSKTGSKKQLGVVTADCEGQRPEIKRQRSEISGQTLEV
jgi:dTDP-4-amino-4,6-dideoxygalactose transaminase